MLPLYWCIVLAHIAAALGKRPAVTIVAFTSLVHRKETRPRFSLFLFYSFPGLCVVCSPSFPCLLFNLTHLFLFQVPRIYWELSTRRVLLMEFMEGGQVNDRAYMERNGIDVNEVGSQPFLNWAWWTMQTWCWTGTLIEREGAERGAAHTDMNRAINLKNLVSCAPGKVYNPFWGTLSCRIAQLEISSRRQIASDNHALILNTPMACSKMAVPVILEKQLQLLIFFRPLSSPLFLLH